MTDWHDNIGLFSADNRQKGGKRTERVADLIRNEISLMLLSRVKDPRLTGVSIVHATVTKDFKRAKIFYSVYGDEQKAQEAATGLDRAKGFIRKYLATNLNLRSTPELVFERDLSMARQEEMENLFKEIHREDESAIDRVGQIVEGLQGKDTILLATHIFPDGDALGSQLALGDILELLGKKVFYFSEAGCSHLYDFIPNCHKLQPQLPDLSLVDAVIALDCGDRFRLGSHMDELLQVAPFIVIDHHAGHKEFGDISWVDDGRSSTGEMVYELASALSATISYEAAFGLYTAIVSDTGSFKYSSTTANTFRVAGELVALGVKPVEVAGKLFDNFTENRLRLLQAVLATLELYKENRIGLITVTQSLFAETDTVAEDTEDFIGYPRALVSVQVAVFIKEAKDDWISVSLRSKGQRDVAQVAREFGGGGHRNAAGFRIQGTSIETVREQLIPALEKVLTGD